MKKQRLVQESLLPKFMHTSHNWLIFAIFFAVLIIPFAGKSQSDCNTAIVQNSDTTVQHSVNDSVFWLKITASLQNIEIFIIDTNTLFPANIDSLFLYSGDCEQLTLIQKSTNGYLFSNSLTSGENYFLKLKRSTINQNLFSILINSLDSTMYDYSWADSINCPPVPFGCECIPNNDFSIYSPTNIQQIGMNEIWAGRVCGWHALRATPGVYNFNTNTSAQIIINDAIWTSLKNVQPNTEYYFDISYWNYSSDSYVHLYCNLTNRDLMPYTLNHQLLISQTYYPLPFVNDPQIADLTSTGTAQTVNFISDFRLLTIPTNLINENLKLYIFQDPIGNTYIDRVSLKPLLRDTIHICIATNATTTLNIANGANQTIIWDDNAYYNYTSRIVNAPGEYWAIVKNNDSCTVKRHLFIVTNSNVIISGNHNTCDSITNYTVSNPEQWQSYQWIITPSNAGSIIQNNNSSITVNWHDWNISTLDPVFIKVVNLCNDTVKYKVWKCCSKDGFTVINDETITTSLTNGTFYLNGDITIGNNVSFNNAMILMGQEARIIVNPSNTLTINTTNIHDGCNYMWDGIYVLNPQTSVISQNNSTIQDAYNAIVSDNGAIVNTSNTAFLKNLKGIVVHNYAGVNPLTVSNCLFYCTSDSIGTIPVNLHPPYTTRRSISGIEISNMNSVTVGNTAKATKNKFSYLDYGIDIANSNVNVYNNNFINLPITTENTGIGVNVTNNSSAQYTVNIGGYNSGNIIYTNLFNNCKTGVNTLGQANLNFIADTLISIQSGFVINNNTNRTIHLSKNRLNLAGNGGAISLTSIAGSKIYIDTNYISSPFMNIPLGIGVENVMPQEVYGVSVRNNTIIGSFKRGIVFTNILKPTMIIPSATERYIPYLYKNSIQLSNLAVALLNNYSGILVSGCTSTTIEENTITKTDGFTTTTETNALRANGINILTSTANYLCNNSVTNMGMGIRYGGNCKPSTNNQNILTANYYGFRLDNAAIGNQGSSIPALNRYLSYDNQWITNYIAAGRVQGSLSETTNWYYRFGTNYTLLPGQFNITTSNLNTTQITPNQTYNCGYDGSIIIGGGGGNSHSMVNTNQTDASADIDYASYPEENLYYDATAVYRTNATLAGVNTGITYNGMDAVSENEIVNPVNIPLFAEVSKEAALGDLTTSISGNSNITPSNLIEKNLQTVNDIYLNSWAKGRFKLSDTEYNTLLDIANQDYISGGYGVFGAEIMTRRYEQAVTAKNKISPIRPLVSDNSNNETEITLYPNPANGNVMINSTQLLDNATVELFAINGTLVSSCTVSANSGYTYQLNISMLKAGIYYCRVTTLEGKQMNSKLVVY